MSKPTKKNIQKLVNALRSGKYTQGRKALQDGDKFCCLGVACKVFVPRRALSLRSLSTEMSGGMPADQPFAPGWLKCLSDEFQSKTGEYLQALNDSGVHSLDGAPLGTLSFDEIADLLQLVYIEEAL